MRLRWTVLYLALVAMAPPAHADNRDTARDEFKTGARYFEIGGYPQALEHFKTAYLAFEDPAILFNIAQCERLLNHKQEALRSYRIYLQKRPEAPNRDQIENIIATLQEAINKDQKASSLPPTGVEGRTPAEGAPATTPTPTPPPVATAPPEAVVATTPPPAPRPPIYKRWWFWAAAGGVAVVALGVGIGVGVASNSHPDFKPTGPDIGPGAATTARLLGGRF